MKFLPFFSILLILGASSCGMRSATTQPIQIDGRWEETWIEENSGVDYHDVYVIEQEGSHITMFCEQRSNYTFTQILLNDHQFAFRVTNPSDPKDPYVMDYSLTVNGDLNEMNGRVKTNHNATADIILKKI